MCAFMHTWGKSDGPGGIRLSFILSLSGLVIPIALILLALRPPVQELLPASPSAGSAQSFQAKLARLEQTSSGSADEVHLSANEIASAFTRSDVPPVSSPPAISLHDDVITGQFVVSVAGQHIYVTVSGHLGAKDGFVTFDPTQFKVGDLSVPVALVNSALQKKLQEQRDQLKLPAFVGDLKVENGEVVLRPK